MFLNMLKFEYGYFLKQPSFVVVSLIVFFMPFLSVAVEQIIIGSNNINIFLNSPFSIALTLLIVGFLGMFLVVNFVANTALRNDTMMMSELLYTNPIPTTSYQLGRFTGAFLIVLTVMLMAPIGLLLGSFMPWLDAERLANFNILYYLTPYIIFTVPTCFILSCIFYAAAIRFKSMMAVYLFALGLFALYALSSGVFADSDQRQLFAMADPFGLRAFFEMTRYWTPSQKNQEYMWLSNEVLQNRILWLLIAIVFLLSLSKLFAPLAVNYAKVLNKSKSTNAKRISGGSILNESEIYQNWINNDINYTYDPQSGFNQFYTLLKFEIKQVLFSPAFIVLIIFAMVSIASEFFDPSTIYGTSHYPLTKFMVELINNAFSLSLLIIITFYSAEIIFRERSTGIGDIIDSTPVANVTLFTSKFIALCLVVIIILAIGMMTAIANQLARGIYNIELQQYLVSLIYFVGMPFILLGVVGFFIQALSPNKYMGMLIFVGFLFLPLSFSTLGFEHNLFNYASAPFLQYSDMNGYAWYLLTQNYYMAYWVSLALVLACFSYALMHRGLERNIGNKLSLLTHNLGKGGQTVVMLGLISFVSFGTVIYYNTTQLNEFKTSSTVRSENIEYEKQFSKYEDAPIISTTHVDLNIAIFPNMRKMEVIAKMRFSNRTSNVINRVLINYPKHSVINIQGANVKGYNYAFKTAWLTFDKPIQPNENVALQFYITRQHRGFKDGNEDIHLVKNGTFINNFDMLPFFGVDTSRYINDPHQRRKHGLDQFERAHPLEDKNRYKESIFGENATGIEFKATISTSNEQTAIAPGKLVRYWQDAGRNYFKYEMNQPMVNFYNIMSAKLKAKTVQHNGVEIAVYYHQAHKYNIDNMLRASMDAIDYFGSEFSPYQYEQLRIVEFPGYENYAQSYANTIAYSERLGFVTDLTNPSIIDSVYYVTAHEVAHQWFGHQLQAANVQGSQTITEGLSQYAALQLMQNTYGKSKIRQFLKYELDAYLRGRSNEDLGEMPLLRDENQNYIHYNKASIVFMAIADRIGTQAMNAAIKELIQQHSGFNMVYSTTLDLLKLIKQNASVEHHQFVEQQFKQITLYDLRLTSADIHEDEQSLELDVFAQQLLSDNAGNETIQPFSDKVDIVIFEQDPNDFSIQPNILYSAKAHLVSGENVLSIPLSQLNIDTKKLPSNIYIGVDPFIRYIDRDSADNIQQLRLD